MLVQIQKMLIQHGYIHKNETCYLSVRLLGNWGVLLYTSAGQYFHIKTETQNALSQEYLQLEDLYLKYSKFMAKPMGYHEYEGQGFLINQAITHEPFSAKMFFQDEILQESVMAYFLKSLEEDKRQTPQNHDFEHQLFSGSQDLIDKTHLNSIQVLYQQIMAQGAKAQHGDFVLNNLGVHNHRLVIFDWEDYGVIQLPGFDLAIFLSALFQFNTKNLVKELYHNSLAQRLVNRYMAGLGYGLVDFIDFLPLYLYAFLYIKQQFGYSEDSIQRTQKSISQFYKLKKVAV